MIGVPQNGASALKGVVLPELITARSMYRIGPAWNGAHLESGYRNFW